MINLEIKKPSQLTMRKPNVFCKNWLPLVEGSPMMMFSPGGIGKSFAAIREAFEYVLETGKKVALWLTEDPEGENRDRYERIIKEYASTPREVFDSRIVFIASQPVKFTQLRDGNAEITDDFWDVRLKLFDYGLVVIDPLLQFNGCDENSNTHAGVLMGAIKDWCAEENKNVLLLHHAAKTEYGFKARGAGEWVNATRGCYEIAKVKGEDGREIQEEKDYRIFSLRKDNGVSFHFRDPITDELSRKLKVFPDRLSGDYLEPTGDKIRISIADHNDAKNPKGFKQECIPFDSLHIRVREGLCYSPYTFADGHRKNENNLGYSDILCLDFDGGMTLVEAEKKFKGVKSLVVTTRSHKKNGNGDRFRLFIKLKKPLSIPASDHADFMGALFDHIGEVDPATKDMARFFFASPEDAFYWYSGSDNEFDWEVLYKEVKKNKVFNIINTRRKVDFNNIKQGPQSNTMPQDTMFTDNKGNTQTFGSIRDTLSYGDKLIVECVKGHGHNGGKGAKYNQAAFIMKADNGNVFYHCSGAKCVNDDAVWCED
ncbi:hypothetical protein THIOSC13_420002 [uncultured Thiomicrorhabdus sp.]